MGKMIAFHSSRVHSKKVAQKGAQINITTRKIVTKGHGVLQDSRLLVSSLKVQNPPYPLTHHGILIIHNI